MRPLAAARRWVLYRSGLPGRLRFDSAILMYHRFGSGRGEHGLARGQFGDQLDYLRQHYDVVSLAEALAPNPGGRPRVSITIDDGYRSFYEYGWPELAARGLTATVFLPSQFIDEGGWMWQDRNIYLLRNATPGTYRLPWQGEELELELADARALIATLLRIYDLGRHLDPDGRAELSASLSSCLGVDLPAKPPAVYAPMNWEQVLELQESGVVFGSHTVVHSILTTCDSETARREIIESRDILAKRLNRSVRTFAYPNGNFDPEIRTMVKQAGYECALATYAGFWSARSDRFAVPRLPAPAGGAAVLADRLWCWWHQFGAPPAQLASTSP